MQTEHLRDRYDARIRALLERVKGALEASGFKSSEGYTWGDEEYEWGIFVTPPLGCWEGPCGCCNEYHPPNFHGDCRDNANRKALADQIGPCNVKIVLLESECRKGNQDGVAWLLDCIGIDGMSIAHIDPYNYTPKLWIPLEDDAAIEERFKILEDADLDGLCALIVTFYEKAFTE